MRCHYRYGGSGFSDRADIPKSSLSESCADILAHAPKKFILVGTSYGGNLALEIALAAPERVIGLWLMGCDPGAPQQGGSDLLGGLEATPDAVIDMLAGLVVRPVDTASATLFKQMAHRIGGPAGAAQARSLGSRSDRTDRLDELNMPTLMSRGADDPLVPQSVGKAMSACITNASWQVLPACRRLNNRSKPRRCFLLRRSRCRLMCPLQTTLDWVELKLFLHNAGAAMFEDITDAARAVMITLNFSNACCCMHVF